MRVCVSVCVCVCVYQSAYVCMSLCVCVLNVCKHMVNLCNIMNICIFTYLCVGMCLESGSPENFHL